MKRKFFLAILVLLFVIVLLFVGKAFLVEGRKFNIDLSPNNSYLKTISFHGVSFMCPASWDVRKKVSSMYEISCEDSSSDVRRSVNFIWMDIEMLPEEWIEEGLKEAEYKLGTNKASVSSVNNSMFNDIKSKSIDISFYDADKKVYGKITSFNFKGNSCIVIMFNDAKIKSDVDFYAIEKSFRVE